MKTKIFLQVAIALMGFSAVSAMACSDVLVDKAREARDRSLQKGSIVDISFSEKLYADVRLCAGQISRAEHCRLAVPPQEALVQHQESQLGQGYFTVRDLAPHVRELNLLREKCQPENAGLAH